MINESLLLSVFTKIPLTGSNCGRYDNDDFVLILIQSDYECEMVTGEGHGIGEQSLGYQDPDACVESCIGWKQDADSRVNGVVVLENAERGHQSKKYRRTKFSADKIFGRQKFSTKKDFQWTKFFGGQKFSTEKIFGEQKFSAEKIFG